VVTLLGRNGMGKTTTVRSIMGLLRPRAGRITFEGREITGRPAYRVAQAGLGLVPEGRQIFPNLTVRENLVATARAGAGPARWTLDRVFDLFPGLAERRRSYGNQLSGGEQQMLALARILRTGAELLLLDEITEGLAPALVKVLGRSVRDLKEKGYTIVMVEQNFRFAAKLADRHYLVERGMIVETVLKDELDGRLDMLHEYLGV